MSSRNTLVILFFLLTTKLPGQFIEGNKYAIYSPDLVVEYEGFTGRAYRESLGFIDTLDVKTYLSDVDTILVFRGFLHYNKKKSFTITPTPELPEHIDEIVTSIDSGPSEFKVKIKIKTEKNGKQKVKWLKWQNPKSLNSGVPDVLEISSMYFHDLPDNQTVSRLEEVINSDCGAMLEFSGNVTLYINQFGPGHIVNDLNSEFFYPNSVLIHPIKSEGFESITMFDRYDQTRSGFIVSNDSITFFFPWEIVPEHNSITEVIVSSCQCQEVKNSLNLTSITGNWVSKKVIDYEILHPFFASNSMKQKNTLDATSEISYSLEINENGTYKALTVVKPNTWQDSSWTSGKWELQNSLIHFYNDEGENGFTKFQVSDTELTINSGFTLHRPFLYLSNITFEKRP